MANLGGAPVAAARARSTLSGLFAWAIAEGLCDKNPVVGTRKPDEGAQARDRMLSDIELAAVWRACPDDDYGRIVQLLIFLGSRRQEIGGMRWSELDKRGAWTLPGARAKNKHALVLPLPSATWGVIRSVPRVADRDHLFSGNAERGFVSWGPAKADLDKKLGSSVAPFKLHDLRRSVATGMCNIGIQPHIVEQILNHRSGHKGGVAGIYNKATYQREVAVALGSGLIMFTRLLKANQERLSRCAHDSFISVLIVYIESSRTKSTYRPIESSKSNANAIVRSAMGLLAPRTRIVSHPFPGVRRCVFFVCALGSVTEPNRLDFEIPIEDTGDPPR